jgi:hypothetical protein
MSHGEIPPAVWEEIRNEFALPTLERVRAKLLAETGDPEPVMRQLVRVFIGDGTFCPGYQFQDDGQLHPTVLVLFARAMELKIAHNYFSAWMITPSPHLEGRRPVDALGGPAPPLLRALETFGP